MAAADRLNELSCVIQNSEKNIIRKEEEEEQEEEEGV